MEKKKEKTNYKKHIKILWITMLSPFLVLFLLILSINFGLFGEMPSFEDLENPNKNIATEIYSSDGVLLGKFYKENRSVVEFEELSPNIINALVATEDYRFKEHSGIDGYSLLRVFFKTFLLGQKGAGGGSTITQQLAKNLFPRDTTICSNFISRKIGITITKLKEWITAVKLEKRYAKDEIILMYLNTVTFGQQAFGIKSASKTFFKKMPKELNIQEAALLVGMLKAPSYFSPTRHNKRATERRNTVLEQMRKYDYITSNECDSISKIPIKLNYQKQDNNEGLSTYFREFLRTYMTKNIPEKQNYYNYYDYQTDSVEWETNPLMGWCNKNKKADGSNFNLYKDGLKIYTTINSKMQKYAEEAVEEHLKYLQKIFFREQKNRKNAPYYDLKEAKIAELLEKAKKNSDRYKSMKNNDYSDVEIDKIFNRPIKMTIFTWNGERDTIMSPKDSIKYYKYFLRAGFISIEPQTGYVRAYVGGGDFKYFKFDNVKLAKRQVGSTFKPFIYTLAMMENSGLTPCSMVPNTPQVFNMGGGRKWIPQNAEGRGAGGMLTLRQALGYSVNNVSAWLTKHYYTPSMMIEVAQNMGIKSYIPRVPSICLGSADISVAEMVGAYTTFANKGAFIEPILVSQIEDRHGNVITTKGKNNKNYTSIFRQNIKEAISEETAYLMLYMMQAPAEFGTSTRLRTIYGLTNQIACKTGTTNDCSDGWFIGIVPKLVSGGWAGGEDRNIHFRSISMGQGASMALPIWALYMKKIYKDKELDILTTDKFEAPEKFKDGVDCSKIGRPRIYGSYNSSGVGGQQDPNVDNNNQFEEEDTENIDKNIEDNNGKKDKKVEENDKKPIKK